jgi:hypothetical protein
MDSALIMSICTGHCISGLLKLKKGEGKENFIYSTPDATGLYYRTAYYRLTRGSDGREYIVSCIDYKKTDRRADYPPKGRGARHRSPF